MSDNPLATLVLLTYRHERYVREALQGALAQTYRPLEIIVSDDASPDNTWQVIQEIAAAYTGPHKLIIRRNENNLGINRHFNALMPLVEGKFVVIAAGDDVSLPERVINSVSLLQQGAAGMHSNGIMVDEESRPLRQLHVRHDQPRTWEEMLNIGGSRVVGATLAWRRQVNEVFGPIPEAPLGEDAFIPFRCALMGGVAYTSDALVHYRSHAGNVSFWKKLEVDERSQTGKLIFQHRIGVLACWESDILVAYQSKYLDELSYLRAMALIGEQSRLLTDLEQSMDMSLPRFIMFIWRNRKTYLLLPNKTYLLLPNPLQLLIEGYLVYTHLNLYRLLNLRQWPARIHARLAKR